MEYQEFSGKDVSDAVTRASVTLGVTSDRLDYEIVEKGSAGFLGFAAKDAVIRARVKEDAEAAAADSAAQTAGASSSDSDAKDAAVAGVASDCQKPSQAEVDSTAASEQSGEAHRSRRSHAVTEEDISNAADAAKQFLKDLFREMQIDAEIRINYEKEDQCLYIELEGPDMGVLIGKRGQTLDALQYLTGIVVSRKIDSFIRVKMDTENYRERRKATLENLAHNVAYKVKKTGKPVALESMSAYERRIIHAALTDDDEVTTHSEGEEPYRHVVVTLK